MVSGDTQDSYDIFAPGDDCVTVLFQPLLFTHKFERINFPAGVTLDEIAYDLIPDPVRRRFAVFRSPDGQIPRDLWARVRPKPKTEIILALVPEGGDSKTLRTVLLISILALAFAAPMFLPAGLAATPLIGSLTYGAALTAGIALVGSVLVNVLVPITPPKLPELAGQGSIDRNSPTLKGTRNRIAKWEPIPVILGRHKVVPNYATQIYTEVVGDDQYMRAIFVFGAGPLFFNEEKIGETDLDNFGGVSSEFRRGYQPSQITTKGSWNPATGVYPSGAVFGDRWTCSGNGIVQDGNYSTGDTITCNALYSDTLRATWDWNQDKPSRLYPVVAVETPLDILAENSVGWITRTTEQDTTEISIDLTFKEGQGWFQEDGDRREVRVTVDIEYRLSSGGSWIVVNPRYNELVLKPKLFRVNRRWDVPEGQYDVRIRRSTQDEDRIGYFDKVWWTAIRSFKHGTPINTDGLCLKIMRIKATDQLRGVIEEYNAVCTSMVPDYDSGSGTWKIRPTSNPASLLRWIWQGPKIINSRPLADNRIDITALEDFHTKNATAGWEFNSVLDYQASVMEISQDICSVAHAVPVLGNVGKRSVVIDEPQTVPTQNITPRNSFDFRVNQKFRDQPHALRIRFFDEDVWDNSERIVFDDGYDDSSATDYETMSFIGITNSDDVWKHGRKRLAESRLRPRKITFGLDFEFIAFQVGDLISVTHDVPSWGLGWGRVRDRTDNGVTCSAIELDNGVTLDAAGAYVVRFRFPDRASSVHAVNQVIGENLTSLTFSTPIPIAEAPEEGDLFQFGAAGAESVDLVVTAIRPRSQETAEIVCMDAAPAVHTAATGTIPAFDPGITLPVGATTPAIVGVRSDEWVMIRQPDGSLAPRLLVNFTRPSGVFIKWIGVEFAFKETNSEDSFVILPIVDVETQQVSILDVEELLSYDVKGRYVNEDGTRGNWGTAITHVIVGKTTLPPDVSLLYSDGQNFLRWAYPSPPPDHAGFAIRYNEGSNTNWDGGTSATSEGSIWPASPFNLAALGGGTKTLMVKAVDSGGRESANAALLVKNLGDVIVGNLVSSDDHRTLGWPDPRVNDTVEGGDLKAITNTVFWPAIGTDLFWETSGGSTFWDSLWENLIYYPDYIPDPADIPAEMTLEHTIVGDSPEILYSVGGSAPSHMWTVDGASLWTADTADFWTAPTGTPVWRPWPGSVLLDTTDAVQLSVSTGSGETRGIISEFVVSLDVDDVIERQQDVVIAIGGTRLSLLKTFRSILNVSTTIQYDGYGGVSSRIIDKNETLGPLIEVVDDRGLGVAGTIDVTLQGY